MIKRSFRTKLVLNFIVSVMLVMLALIAAVFFIYKPILVLDIRDNMVAYTKLTSTAYENGSTNIKRNLDMWSSSKNINSVIYGDAMEIIDYSGEYVFPESTRMMMLKNWNDIYNEEKNSDPFLPLRHILMHLHVDGIYLKRLQLLLQIFYMACLM